MAKNKVSVEISVEERAALKALTKLTKGVDKTTTEAVRDAKKMDAAFASFAGNLAANFAGKAIGAVTGAFGELTGIMSESIALAQVQEDAIKRLNVALKASGIFTKEVSEDFQAYASELQKATKFGDEIILENAALIQSLGQLDKEGLKKATAASLDLASALGVSLNTAALLVGKAAAGEVSTFSRYGLIIKKGADNAETFANALDGINSKFGGAAAAQVNTFSGAVEQLSNSWGDAKEEIGFAFTENEKIKTSIKELNKFVVTLGGKIAEVAPDIVKSFVDMAQAAGKFFFDNEADEAFAKKGLVGLRKELGNLEARVAAVKENKFNLPDFLLGDEAELSERVSLYRKKLAEVTKSEKEFVTIRQGNADEMNAILEGVFGRSEFVTAPKDTTPAEEDPRVDKEKEVSEKVIEQRRLLAAELAVLEQDRLTKEAESSLAQKELTIEERAIAIEELKFHEIQKADAVLNAQLDKNAKIKDLEAKRLADQKAFIQNDIAISQAQAKAKREIATQELKDEQVFFQKAVSLSNSKNKELAAIGKAAGLVQIAMATPPAIASSFNFGSRIGGPVLGGIFAGIAAAAQAEQAAKMAGFEGGGVIGGFSGATNGRDQTTFRGRTGEMMLNASQQRQLFDFANGSQINDNNENGKSLELTTIVQIDEREIARAVRNQKLDGFAA